MFFAPPKVKSLSRYAEQGSYIGNKHFLMMLAIAMAGHLSIIGIYSMVPHEEVVRIPVRALNIKLSGGNPASIHMTPTAPRPQSLEAPAPQSSAKQEEDEELHPLSDATPEATIDRAMTPKLSKEDEAKKIHLPKSATKDAKTTKKGTNAASSTFSTPKKYVRGSEMSLAKGHNKNGNGSNISGVAGGQEVMSRYTQVVSQWISNHQSMAKAACGEAREVTGSCNAKGQTVVRFRINREGHILSNSVEHTSGSELVDQAAIVMVQASDPVPSVPTDYPSDSQLEFVIPIQVDLAAKN